MAAELIELAIKLGGDTPLRRIRAAEQHFRSGALDRAGARLRSTVDRLEPGSTLRCAGLMLLAAVTGLDESMAAAVAALNQAVDETDDPVLQLQGRLILTPATALIGQMADAVDHARVAVAEAERLGIDGLLSQALAMRVTVYFLHGLGFDRPAMQRALELETPGGWAGATFQATAVAAVAAAWDGDLMTARERMHKVQRQYLHEGNEVDILWVAHHATMIDLWLGRYREAAATADDAVQRAEQLGGKHMLTTAWTCQAAAAAYAGREDETRKAARAAIDAARTIGTEFLVGAAITTLGFVEVSLGNYADALAELGPLLASFDSEHGTEIMVGSYLPDAIEALTALGRLDEADPLVAALETNGAQHDRAWMLAAGARGRSHVLAARGDLDAAEDAAHEAVRHHQRLPMPFELARTQLLLGQLQRRRRRKQAAEATLCAALETFDRLGAPLWSRRTRIELERLNVPVADSDGLTAAERRVAELAASGMSNKQIAAELFIAPKTVEMNLSSVYRKLGIRSRSGLAGALKQGIPRESPDYFQPLPGYRHTRVQYRRDRTLLPGGVVSARLGDDAVRPCRRPAQAGDQRAAGPAPGSIDRAHRRDLLRRTCRRLCRGCNRGLSSGRLAHRSRHRCAARPDHRLIQRRGRMPGKSLYRSGHATLSVGTHEIESQHAVLCAHCGRTVRYAGCRRRRSAGL